MEPLALRRLCHLGDRARHKDSRVALDLVQLVPVVNVVRSGLLLLLSTLVAPPGLGPWNLPRSAFPPPISGLEAREALPPPTLGSEARLGSRHPA